MTSEPPHKGTEQSWPAPDHPDEEPRQRESSRSVALATIVPEHLRGEQERDRPSSRIEKLSPPRTESSGPIPSEDPLGPGMRILPGHRDADAGEVRDPVTGENPYTGLAAFQEADAPRFFGRDRDIAGTLSRLHGQRLVAVVGPSGVGKSSFVRAGIIPALKRSGDGWEAYIIRPGREPLTTLVGLLEQVSPEHTIDPGELHTEPGLLGAGLRNRRRNKVRRILLFVDQFEELYTICTNNDQRDTFVACLEGVADDAASPLRVMLALRSDFLDRVADDRGLMSEIIRGMVFLTPIDRAGLRDALTRPLAASGYRFESDELVDTIVDTLATSPSPLPLLQSAAARLWERRDRKRRLLTAASYEELGGVAGALSGHADAVPAGRRRRNLVLGLIVTLVAVAVTVSYLAVQANREARRADLEAAETAREAERARQQAMRARDAARIVWSQQLQDDPTRAMALLRETEEPERGHAWSIQASILARTPVSQVVLSGHREVLHQAVFSPDGRWVATASADKTTRIWRADGRGTAVVFRGHTDAVLRVAFSPDGSRILTGSGDGTARIWNSDGSGTPIVLRGHTDKVYAIGFSRDGKRVVTGSWDGTARIWSIDVPGVPIILRGHHGHINWAEFSPDGTRVATAGSDGTGRLWNADGLGGRVVLRGHEGTVYMTAFSPDGKRVVTASPDHTARIWNADGSGEPIVLAGHQGSVTWATFDHDGKHVVTASWDATARVWNSDGSGESVVLRGHSGPLLWAVFSPDGGHIVTSSWDRTARIWNSDGSGNPRVLRGHTQGLAFGDISPDGGRVITASYDRSARIWDMQCTEPPVALPTQSPNPGVIETVRFTPDGESVILPQPDHTIRVASLRGPGAAGSVKSSAGEDYPRLEGAPGPHAGSYTLLAMSRDGRYILTKTATSHARLWTVGAPGKTRTLEGPRTRVVAGRFSPDGSHAITIGLDGRGRLWNTETGRRAIDYEFYCPSFLAEFSADGKSLITSVQDPAGHKWMLHLWSIDGLNERVLEGHEGIIHRLTFSPDSKLLASVSQDTTARIYRADGSEGSVVFEGHTAPVRWVAFSPDSKRVVTASEDKTARIWNSDGTGEVITLRGHSGAVLRATFSPDGTRVLTASADETARVWSADSSGVPIVLKGHTGPVVAGSFSPDGTRALTISNDRTVRVWSDVIETHSLQSLQHMLWQASNYCLALDTYRDLLGVDERFARTAREKCQRRFRRAAP